MQRCQTYIFFFRSKEIWRHVMQKRIDNAVLTNVLFSFRFKGNIMMTYVETYFDTVPIVFFPQIRRNFVVDKWIRNELLSGTRIKKVDTIIHIGRISTFCKKKKFSIIIELFFNKFFIYCCRKSFILNYCLSFWNLIYSR